MTKPMPNAGRRALKLGCLAALCVAGLYAQATPAKDELARTAHRTHKLHRPADYSDFRSLEEWIQANYTSYLVTGSMARELRDGKEWVSFLTAAEDGVYDHHALRETEAGDGFELETTALLPAEMEASLDEKAGGTREAATGCEANACNCTLYARCKVRSFPSPATYYTEKIKYANSPLPLWGAVAIMNISPPYGHLGIVNGISFSKGSLMVTLDEANYRACTITTTRTGTPASMKITGYYVGR